MSFLSRGLIQLLLGAWALAVFAQGSAADYERALRLTKDAPRQPWRAGLQVHWEPDGRHLWYRVQTGPAAWEYARVELPAGLMQRADRSEKLGLPTPVLKTSEMTVSQHPSGKGGDETSLRFTNQTAGLVRLAWVDPNGKRRSYGALNPSESKEQNTFAGHVWIVTDASGEVLAAFEATPEPAEIQIDGKGRAAQRDQAAGGWKVRFENNQVVWPDTLDARGTPLTVDGTDARPYRGPVDWAPDGQSFVVQQVELAPVRKISVIESSPPDQLQPKVLTFDYPKPGDPLPKLRPVLVPLATLQPQPIANELFPNPFTPEGRLGIRWSLKSDEFYFDDNERGHQLYRILAVNALTGAVRVVVEEKARTFIDYTNKTWRHWLDGTGELLWMSERDGWCHLWLYDVASGVVKKQVTHGSWVVRKVEWVDETKRQVWLMAGGLRPGEDPYHEHLCRVNFDGSGFVQLTEGDGKHAVAFSPDHRFFVDTWSRVDQPPVTELRHSDDGALVCELERAEAASWLAAGWTMPERFTAKGRDGTTDIYGILIKPSNFDPARR